MFGLFNRRTSILASGLLRGAVDQHSHILYGLDDGVKMQEDSLAILGWLEEQGVSEVWFTPHIMEDVDELKAVYTGGLTLNLAAEYMIDTVFEDRLDRRDLLEHGPETVLVETSAIAPPMNLWAVLDRILKAGYRPLIAHPERYRYMDQGDYRELHNLGCFLQLNLPSIVGFYGEEVRQRAVYLLDKGWYRMVGSDCHRFRAIQAQYTAKELKKETIAKLSALMEGSDEI